MLADPKAIVLPGVEATDEAVRGAIPVGKQMRTCLGRQGALDVPLGEDSNLVGRGHRRAQHGVLEHSGEGPVRDVVDLDTVAPSGRVDVVFDASHPTDKVHVESLDLAENFTAQVEDYQTILPTT